MKQFTIDDIRRHGPCYDPAKYLPENWQGTILDILSLKDCPFQDRLWVILRTDFLSEKLMRLFALWCARQVQHLMPDQRSIDALDFMDAYCEYYFEIDDEGWRSAWECERAAARAAARDAAREAAWAAAKDAASDAARAVASDAAWAAAQAAAWAAAETAALDAAWAAAETAQENKLREMILAGIEAGDTL